MISVGIDVSKGKSTVCIMKPCGEVLKSPFEMLHSIDSILHLVKLIKSYDEEVCVISEDTGHHFLMNIQLSVDVSYNIHRKSKFLSAFVLVAKTLYHK